MFISILHSSVKQNGSKMSVLYQWNKTDDDLIFSITAPRVITMATCGDNFVKWRHFHHCSSSFFANNNILTMIPKWRWISVKRSRHRQLECLFPRFFVLSCIEWQRLKLIWVCLPYIILPLITVQWHRGHSESVIRMTWRNLSLKSPGWLSFCQYFIQVSYAKRQITNPATYNSPWLFGRNESTLSVSGYANISS